MAKIEFNLTGLRPIYEQACHSDGKFLAFDLSIGRGRFLFMMFLSEEDGGNKDILFLYLRNTNTTCTLKTYGHHLRGDFKVYFTDSIQEQVLRELQLQHLGKVPFSFKNFLEEVNARIPAQLNRTEMIHLIRNNRTHIPAGLIEETEKTVLIGTKQLPENQRPQDKTLRKLLLYVDGNEDDIICLITALKKKNCTVCWTTEDNRFRTVGINVLINDL